MRREPVRVGMCLLLRAGLQRSRWRSAAAALVALIAAGALFGALALTAGMERLLDQTVARLGAEILLVPKGKGAAVERLLQEGATEPLEATLSVAGWKRRLKEGKVVGILAVEGWSLTRGGAGEPAAGDQASVVLVRLESWASPMIARQEISAALPEADVVVAEQASRQVARHLRPLVRNLAVAGGVALLAAVLITGLLTAIRVGERRGELGMMRAMGATRAFLIGLTLAETALPAAAGGLAGVALVAGAGLGSGSFARLVGALPSGVMLLYGSGALLATVLVALAAALGPALRAATMDPLEAARRGR